MSVMKSIPTLTKIKALAEVLAEQIYIRNSSDFGIERAKALCEKALEINHNDQYNLDERQVIVSSMFHACMHHRDNENYEEASAHFVYMLPYNNEPIFDLLGENDEERTVALSTMTLAVMEHRLNFKGEFSSLLSTVLHEANKQLGEPESKVIPKTSETNFGNNLPNAGAATSNQTAELASLKH